VKLNLLPWVALGAIVLGCEGPSASPTERTETAPADRAPAPGEWDTGKIAVATPIIDGKYAEDWIRILGSGDADDRRRAVEKLRAFAGYSDAAVTALAKALQDPDAEVRLHSAHVLGEFGPQAKDAIPALIQAGEDELDSVREAAAQALRKIDPAARAVEGGPVRDRGAPPVGKCP